jgi:hypothetical protein
MNGICRSLGLVSVLLVLLPEAVLAAGDVTVVEKDENIVIRGDRQSNTVVIDINTVSGEDGTTINGGSNPIEIPPDGGFDIDLKGGDDFIDLQDVHRTFLHIQMGKENDVLVFADAGASGDCTVDMGKGDDIVVGDFIEDCGGGLTVDTGQGNDLLHFLTTCPGTRCWWEGLETMISNSVWRAPSTENFTWAWGRVTTRCLWRHPSAVGALSKAAGVATRSPRFRPTPRRRRFKDSRW